MTIWRPTEGFRWRNQNEVLLQDSIQFMHMEFTSWYALKCVMDCNDMQGQVGTQKLFFHKKVSVNFDLKIKCPLIMEVPHSSYLQVFATALWRKTTEHNTTYWPINSPHSYSDPMAGWVLRGEAEAMQKFLLWEIANGIQGHHSLVTSQP